jgi:hypothetical protein
MKELEQGPDRQRAPEAWCSRGVSSIRGASESRCSHNGHAHWGPQRQQQIRHFSSPGATGVHKGGFMGLARVVTGVLHLVSRPGDLRAKSLELLQD